MSSRPPWRQSSKYPRIQSLRFIPYPSIDMQREEEVLAQIGREEGEAGGGDKGDYDLFVSINESLGMRKDTYPNAADIRVGLDDHAGNLRYCILAYRIARHEGRAGGRCFGVERNPRATTPAGIHNIC
jgi:hypothetical protein